MSEKMAAVLLLLCFAGLSVCVMHLRHTEKMH